MTPVGAVTTIDYDYGSAVVVMGTFACDECDHFSIGFAHSERANVPNPKTWIEYMATHDSLKWIPAKGTPKPYEDVPQHIAAAASEAHECHGIGAYRAAVQMARSVVEATAKEKGITKGTLVQKIDEMDTQRLLRPHIREAAHEIRHLGNEMAHGDFVQPVTEEESEETLGLMAEILNEVFQSPARVERRKQARAARNQP
ncbi:DUF4145 domain-containing protein [Actinosynnema sp. NPDC059335]|uniref:DUF4145 domain-containing protein n=1 Tax=Actinosynnema sp. NPDC059335 TaxID=3346804 RepID=UPI003670C082